MATERDIVNLLTPEKLEEICKLFEQAEPLRTVTSTTMPPNVVGDYIVGHSPHAVDRWINDFPRETAWPLEQQPPVHIPFVAAPSLEDLVLPPLPTLEDLMTPSQREGTIRFNGETEYIEYFEDGAWHQILSRKEIECIHGKINKTTEARKKFNRFQALALEIEDKLDEATEEIKETAFQEALRPVAKRIITEALTALLVDCKSDAMGETRDDQARPHQPTQHPSESPEWVITTSHNSERE